MELHQALIDALPDCMIVLENGTISSFNAAAAQLLPGLAPGMPTPQALIPVIEREGGHAEFHGTPYRCVFAASGGQILLMFSPAGITELSGVQLDGTVLKLREQLNLLFSSLSLLSARLSGPEAEYAASLNRQLHRMVRLVQNLDFVLAEKVAFSPVMLDFVGLCRILYQHSQSPMRELGITLYWDCSLSSVLLPGDSTLLQRMFLGLLSNCAKQRGVTEIYIRLRRTAEHIVLSISDNGTSAYGAFAEQSLVHDLLAPNRGAGLGLSVIRRIAELHGGRLLQSTSDLGGLESTVPLPTGRSTASLQVKAPFMEEGGGFSPLLVELSDVLSERFYLPDGNK